MSLGAVKYENILNPEEAWNEFKKYLIEYEPANSYAVQTQRRGRVKRANSTSRISYIYQLITADSWDNIALKSINKKKGYDDSLKNL